MGCSCSSDYSDSEWIENLDEICEHCNCPIAPQSCNPVSVCTRLFNIHSVWAYEHSAWLKWTWEVKHLCRLDLKDWASPIIFSHQYTDQLISYHSSHYSPPSSPLPGNYIAFVCSAGFADILCTHKINFSVVFEWIIWNVQSTSSVLPVEIPFRWMVRGPKTTPETA